MDSHLEALSTLLRSVEYEPHRLDFEVVVGTLTGSLIQMNTESIPKGYGSSVLLRLRCECGVDLG